MMVKEYNDDTVAEGDFSFQIKLFLDPNKRINHQLSSCCCSGRQQSSSSCPFHQSITEVLLYIQTISRSKADADKKMAKLILSGLIPACLHVIDCHYGLVTKTKNASRRSSSNHENNTITTKNDKNNTKKMCTSVRFAKAIIQAATETDTPWSFINIVRDHVDTKASDVGGFIGSDAKHLQMLSRRRNETTLWCRNNKKDRSRDTKNAPRRSQSFHRYGSANERRTTLIGLALMKILNFAIRYLAALDDDDDNYDRFDDKKRQDCRNPHLLMIKEELIVYITRLIARCLSTEVEEEEEEYKCDNGNKDGRPRQVRRRQQFLLSDSKELLVAGSNEQKWIEAATSAEKEYSSQSITSCYLCKDAVVRILQPPSYQDRSLFRWMLRPDVFNAIEGWIYSGAWKHPHAQGGGCTLPPSWRRFRTLLIIGARGNSSMTADIMCTYTMTPLDNTSGHDGDEEPLVSSLDHQTLEAAAALRTRSHEKSNGTKIYICSALGCHKHATSMKRCSNCMLAQYCNIKCQLSHWKQAHQNECKILSSSSSSHSSQESFPRIVG